MARHRGFTLVELLVVIAIIGVLVSLMMPAIGAVRETGRKAQCKNNLTNIGKAVQSHMTAFSERLPSGGWGHAWVGEPEIGTGDEQPGGWCFNLLNYLEQENLRNVGLQTTGSARATALKQRGGTPVAVFVCPTRREAVTLPDTNTIRNKYRTFDQTGIDFLFAGRSDYAINTGSGLENESGGGPNDMAGGEALAPAKQNGLCYRKSVVVRAMVRDGMSSTYLIGEKYLNPLHYTTGGDGGDNENMYTGYDNDQQRITHPSAPPMQDRTGVGGTLAFGSAHSGGFMMVLGDGSARQISYSIDPTIHERLGNRADGGGAIDTSDH